MPAEHVHTTTEILGAASLAEHEFIGSLEVQQPEDDCHASLQNKLCHRNTHSVFCANANGDHPGEMKSWDAWWLFIYLHHHAQHFLTPNAEIHPASRAAQTGMYFSAWILETSSSRNNNRKNNSNKINTEVKSPLRQETANPFPAIP